MFRRRISGDEIREVIRSGKTIEAYPDDRPYPSRLICSDVSGRILHVVAADDESTQTCIIITAYEPTLERWEPGFERRRS